MDMLAGGTNENERWIECKYRVIGGELTPKRLRPIRVKGTNSEGTMFRLDTLFCIQSLKQPEWLLPMADATST